VVPELAGAGATRVWACGELLQATGKKSSSSQPIKYECVTSVAGPLWASWLIGLTILTDSESTIFSLSSRAQYCARRFCTWYQHLRQSPLSYRRLKPRFPSFSIEPCLARLRCLSHFQLAVPSCPIRCGFFLDRPKIEIFRMQPYRLFSCCIKLLLVHVPFPSTYLIMTLCTAINTSFE
jgi:hypothetical protein